MSVQRIQDGLSNCCQGFKEIAVTSAQWGAKTCQTGFQYVSDLASRIAAWIQPFFESAKQFAQENPTLIMVGFGCAAAGAVVSTLFSKICCQEEPQIKVPVKTQRA